MHTEIIAIDADKQLFYVQASTFPEGVQAAFDKLQGITGITTFDEVFGVSHMGPDGKIIYKAAAQETYEGEAEQKGCPAFTLKKGTYCSCTIKDWQRHMDQFQPVFTHLLQHPDLDPKGACVEWYKGVDEVICMVRLKNDTRASS